MFRLMIQVRKEMLALYWITVIAYRDSTFIYSRSNPLSATILTKSISLSAWDLQDGPAIQGSSTLWQNKTSCIRKERAKF